MAPLPAERLDGRTAPPTAPLVERAGAQVDPLALTEACPGPQAMLLTVRGWRVVLPAAVGFAHDLESLELVGGLVGWAAAPTDGPPFTGGAAGFLTDEAASGFLGLPARTPRRRTAPLPGVLFGIYDSAVCIDPHGVCWLVAADLPGHSRAPARRRLSHLRQLVSTVGRPSSADPVPERTARTTISRPEHADRVRTILEWIAAGDLYQLNLTCHVGVPWTEGGAVLARRLWDASPDAAHACWLRADGTDIVSVSPETFVRTDGDRITTRPIKGTRRRRSDPQADEAEARTLRTSVKDRAEHVMIVDLERNDLGRVCVTGSVIVPALAVLEAHPTVWHLTSTVEGRLRCDVSLSEVLAATFPCGSVTGAPKRMAVSRIPELEPVGRGVYCGAIGVVSRGLVDFSVAIRTAVVHDGVAWYGTGGGIVADSDPDEEWDETLAKAEAFLTATNATIT